MLTLKELAALMEGGHVIAREDGKDYTMQTYDNGVIVTESKMINYAFVGLGGDDGGYAFFKDCDGRFHSFELPPAKGCYYLTGSFEGGYALTTNP